MILEDLLCRDHFVSVVSNIVESKIQQREGYSFAIDGEWGCGKTTVLDMLEERLKNCYLVIRYNCWKYDFYEEPLIALLSEFAKAINAEQAFEFEENEKKVWEIAGKICSDVTSKLIQAGTGFDIKSAVRYVNSIRKIAKEKRIKYEDVNNKLPIEFLIEQIQNDLATLSSFENRGIVLMVDELDRCLPDYAIKVLERLHHFCDNTRIIQILAINKKEMSGSIAKAFGYPNTDFNMVEYFADHYMQKFIDMTLSLNNGTLNDPQVDLLSSLEKKYKEQDKLNKVFVADFIRKVLCDIPMRNLKQAIKSVSSIHNISLCEYSEKNHKFSYALMCAEILECIQLLYFKYESDMRTSGSKNNFVRVELNASMDAVHKDFKDREHADFNIRIRNFFSSKTNLLEPIFTGRNDDVYNFKLDTPQNKILYIFIPPGCDYLSFDIKAVPDYLKKDAEFFKIFRQNLKELKIQ